MQLEQTIAKLMEDYNVAGMSVALIRNGDIVTVFFDVQGTSYTDKATGKTKNFTGIRAYDVEVKRTAGGQAVQQQSQAPAPQPQPAPQAQSPFVGEDNKGDLPL